MALATKTEGKHAAEWLVSEANGTQSRDAAILIAGQNLVSGAVLGKITASGKYTALNTGAADGSQTAAAFLYDNTDATLADTACVVISRIAEVNDKEVTWTTGMTAPQKATARTQLAGATILVRQSGSSLA